MNNKDKYKSAIDQIHVREELKKKTLNKVTQKKSKLIYFKYVSTIAAVALFAIIGGVTYHNHIKESLDVEKTNYIAKSQISDLKRFDNMQELRNALKEQESKLYSSYWLTDDLYETTESLDVDLSSFNKNDSIRTNNANTSESKVLDYSKTNTQVENVDEADIIKTDGENIYCVSNNIIFIIEADSLKEISKIKFDDEFRVSEIFLKADSLVVLGNSYESNKEKNENDTDSYMYINYSYYTEARVYDISNKKQPKEFRKVALEGNYINSRMIGDNIYFISSYSLYSRKNISECDDKELLPRYKDSKLLDQEQYVNYTDIAYFENTNDFSYTMVAGFDITKKNDVSVETFLGAGYSEVYASEENLYLVIPEYENNYLKENSKIYKFVLENGNIVLKCKGIVPGYIDNQFSIDEYKGNLRIATTINVMEKDNKYYSKNTTTQLTILDENLNQIGEIEDLAYGEKIYSVRFMGDIGYIVTFEEVDPLFVIDLSNPKLPKVKGELKIPGYSSYLHMYDDTHVIGIGYNTKDNGYGGVKNDSMKMSMFDVSDLSNPIEMFSIDIGDGYVYSEIISNHKALFFNKNKNLIGFPVNSYSNNSKSGLILFEIDLKNGFKEYDDLMDTEKTYKYIERAIYIDDVIYTFEYDELSAYDLNTFDSLGSIDLYE